MKNVFFSNINLQHAFALKKYSFMAFCIICLFSSAHAAIIEVDFETILTQHHSNQYFVNNKPVNWINSNYVFDTEGEVSATLGTTIHYTLRFNTSGTSYVTSLSDGSVSFYVDQNYPGAYNVDYMGVELDIHDDIGTIYNDGYGSGANTPNNTINSIAALTTYSPNYIWNYPDKIQVRIGTQFFTETRSEISTMSDIQVGDLWGVSFGDLSIRESFYDNGHISNTEPYEHYTGNSYVTNVRAVPASPVAALLITGFLGLFMFRVSLIRYKRDQNKKSLITS